MGRFRKVHSSVDVRAMLDSRQPLTASIDFKNTQAAGTKQQGFDYFC
jgi:hypothetical protein